MLDLKNIINRHQFLSRTLLFLAGCLILLIAAKVSAFVLASNKIPDDIARAISAPQQIQGDVKKYQSRYSDATAALKKKNLFMPPVAQKTNPISRVTAVFGSEAMISNKWYKVGDKIQDAEITNISPNEVTVKWNDKESKLKPFDTVILAAAPKTGSKKNKDRDSEEKDKDKDKDKKDKKEPGPEQADSRQPMRRPMPSEEERRKRMQEYMNNMTPEQRARFEQRRNSRGSRGGPGGGSRGGGRPRGGGSRGPR